MKEAAEVSHYVESVEDRRLYTVIKQVLEKLALTRFYNPAICSATCFSPLPAPTFRLTTAACTDL